MKISVPIFLVKVHPKPHVMLILSPRNIHLHVHHISIASNQSTVEPWFPSGHPHCILCPERLPQAEQKDSVDPGHPKRIKIQMFGTKAKTQENSKKINKKGKENTNARNPSTAKVDISLGNNSCFDPDPMPPLEGLKI